MKLIVKSIALLSLLVVFMSCEKDEGKLPSISFKTGGSYTSTDVSLAPGTSFTIGISASKSEKKDVLKKFSITKSVNGGTATTVYTKDLGSDEEDNFSYDFTSTADASSSNTNKYVFTITNRDGLTNQLSVTVTSL